MKNAVILMLSLFSGVRTQRCGENSTDAIMINYTAENTRPEAGEVFSANEAVYVLPGSTAFDMMQIAETCNDEMELIYSMGEYGAYIEGINGVMADDANQLFWAFMKVDGNGHCLHNYGVSTIVPVHEENVLMSMEYYSIFDEVPNCETGEPEPHSHYLGAQ